MLYYGRRYIDLRISCMRFRNQKGTAHGGRHAAIFLTGELCIQERHVVFLFIFPCENDTTRSYIVVMYLPLLC